MAFQNFFATKAFTDIGSSDTTITLETPPTALSGRLVLEARNATQREIIKYTGVSGNQITGVTRGQGGTTAKSHLKNSLVEMNATSEDLQDLYDAFGTFAAVNNDWLGLVPTVTSVVYNGQRSYDVTFNSTVAATLSPGMRLRIGRTINSPTQCALFNGTTQYYSKAAPAGMTFTDDFVVGAWVKLSSYTQGGIISRADIANGWALQIIATGQIELFATNGAAANYVYARSYQSVPLNKWSHIAAQLDMSAFTATTTTCYIMVDGVDVPITLVRGGTNPTALVQGGNLEVGTFRGSSFFPGKIAQPFVTSVKVIQVNVRLLISQGITPALITAHNIISAYSFDNIIVDLNTTNANNLTANGAVVATNADSPFGIQASGSVLSTIDYAIISKVNSAVVTMQVPEGGSIPTSGGVSSVSYASASVPFGFPAQSGKWELEMLIRHYLSTPIGGLNQWYPSTSKFIVPMGQWSVGMSGVVTADSSAGGVRSGFFAMSSTFPVNGQHNPPISGRILTFSGASAQMSINNSRSANLSATNTYEFYGAIDTASGSETWGIRGDAGEFQAFARNSYL